jgi:hypothetical protein
MVAPAIALELHERGNHAVRPGAGDVEVTKVRFRSRVAARRDHKLTSIA